MAGSILTGMLSPRRRWPGSCEVCRSWSDSSCCSACLALFGHERPRCPRCAEASTLLPDTGGSPICTACQRQQPPFVRARVAFDYAFPWDGLIQQLKFAGRTELAGPLAEALTGRILQARLDEVASGAHAPVDCVLPMPLSPARLAERGYNQALLLARHVARILDVPLDTEALLRPIDAAHQVDLTREQRINNLRGAFMLDPKARPRIQNRRVALVDDVITTGSTASEASRELLRAGAQSVEVWAVARTAAH
jgi:ComF family protein